MSQFLLCKGVPPEKIVGFKIIQYPFSMPWLDKASQILWGNDNESIWTVLIESQPIDIDFCFTDAQKKSYSMELFKQTTLYYLLNEILRNKVDIVLWYSEIHNDIHKVKSKADFFEKVYEGIKSDFCEVNIRYSNYI